MVRMEKGEAKEHQKKHLPANPAAVLLQRGQ